MICLLSIVSGILMDGNVYFCSTNEMICGRKVNGDNGCILPPPIQYTKRHRTCGLPTNGATFKHEFGDGKTSCKDAGFTKYCNSNNKEYLPRHFMVVGDEGRENGYRIEPEFSKIICSNCNSARQYKAEQIKFRYAGNLTFTMDEETGKCKINLEILVVPSSGYWGGPRHCNA